MEVETSRYRKYLVVFDEFHRENIENSPTCNLQITPANIYFIGTTTACYAIYRNTCFPMTLMSTASQTAPNTISRRILVAYRKLHINVRRYIILRSYRYNTSRPTLDSKQSIIMQPYILVAICVFQMNKKYALLHV